MKVETEKPDNKTHRRLDAGWETIGMLIAVTLFSPILLPCYVSGFIVEKLGVVEYEKPEEKSSGTTSKSEG